MAVPSRPPHTGLVHFACATAFYWVFQLGLCLVLYDETDSHESRCTEAAGPLSYEWAVRVEPVEARP